MHYIIPFYYLFKSRLKRNHEKISWIIINPIPILFLSLYLGEFSIFDGASIFFMALCIWQSIYEIGYIENDVITTKKEKNPTFRVNAGEDSFLESRRGWIEAARWAIAVSTFLFLISLDQQGLRLSAFAGLLIFTRAAFLAHNKIRNRLNILTYFVLSATKYAAIPVLMVRDDTLLFAIAITLTMFPLIRTLEHATKRKYALEWLRKRIDKMNIFRVKYYFLCFISAAAVFLYTGCSSSLAAVVVFSYFLLYRLGAWQAVEKGVVRPTTHNGY